MQSYALAGRFYRALNPAVLAIFMDSIVVRGEWKIGGRSSVADIYAGVTVNVDGNRDR